MKTILLIEDKNAIRENIAEFLELEGYRVILANNGKTGLSLAKTVFPDIILSDILMPELDGHEVFAALKKEKQTFRIPFIFVTSSAEKSELQAALDKGVDGYIRKPFELEELLETVERCLALVK